jgi:3-isopropylmalate/(R)-2-methylmalate dehydratase large subunit
MTSKPQTLFDKLWSLHVVKTDDDGEDILAIDRVVLHERTGGVALKALAESGYAVADPGRVFAVMDHVVSSRPGRGRDEARFEGGEIFITETRRMAAAAGVTVIDTDDARQGIVHVVAPEQAIVLPGASLVCPDSHTCSLGALGALAWGVGSSEAEHAMATSTLRVRKPAQMRVRVDGKLGAGVTAKDLALHLIAIHGAGGGRRCAIEFTGEAIAAMSLEARLTLCNLAVEFAAFTAVIAPDAAVYEYLQGRPRAPRGAAWEAARAHWDTLRTDNGATFDHEIVIDARAVAPTVSWGTSPQESAPISGVVPATAPAKSLAYMALSAGQGLTGLPIDGAFIGSCTNGRLSDLRAAAAVLKGRRVASRVRAVCVPGSQQVKAAAEAEGLDKVFRDAGFEWGEPGCAMCFYAGGATFPPGARVISSTNRNFEGRQGPGVRTHLASPETVAASAVKGSLCSAEMLLLEEAAA